MLSHVGTIIVLCLVLGLGLSAVILSFVILRRGKLYHRLTPEARPRRWVLIFSLILLAVFVIWFPVWITWPNALISRLLAGLFGLTFAAAAMTFKWLAPVVDSYIQRKGWHLR